MSSFIGFSEDDIQKVQNGVGNGQKKTQKEVSTDVNVKIKKASLKVQPKHSKNVEVQNVTVLEVPKSRLFTKEDEHKPNNNLSVRVANGNDEKVIVEEDKENIHKNGSINESKDNNTAENGVICEATSTTFEIQQIKQKFKDLEEFQARQKQIEEDNKRRKELLTKALEDRTKQTQAEAQRLTEIQNEFKKLDAILSNDVKILRKEIEVASVDYTEAQKRYHKIEKEFLEAKLCLHQKLERKEMLTEHLCTIIEENEDRKAKKLTELLNKLQVIENEEMNTTTTVEGAQENS